MDCAESGCNTGISLDELLALQRVQCTVKSRGIPIYIKLDDESTIERDSYGSIKKRESSTTTIYAYPIVFSPSQKQKDRNGIKNEVEVMVTTPMQCWLDAGFSDTDLSHIDTIRATVFLRGQTYEIKDKNMDSQFGSTFLYVILGLNRK